MGFAPGALLGQANFRADDPTLPPGTPVTLRWDASIAYGPVLNPGNLPVSNGEIRLIPPAGKTVYQLSYLQGRTPRVESVTVETGLPPSVGPLTSSPLIARANQPVTFSFSASRADSVTVWKREVGTRDWLPTSLGAVTGDSFTLALATDASVRVEAANAFGLARSGIDVGVVFPTGNPPAPPVNAPVSPGLPAALSNRRFRSQLVPVEIMSSPATRTEAEKAAGFSRQDFGWMELRNLDYYNVSLSNYQLRGGVTADLSRLAPGVVLSPGQSVILANSRAAFIFRHGTPSVPLYGLGKPIATRADSFQLVWSKDFSADAKLAHEVSFDASRDGLDLALGGHSLVLRNLSPRALNGTLAPADWTTGTRFGGTPGAVEPAGSGELLLLTEIFAAGASGRAIEVNNPTYSYIAGPNLWHSNGSWGNSLPLDIKGALSPGNTNAIWKDAPAFPAPRAPGFLMNPLGDGFALARSFPGGFPHSLVAFAEYGPMAPGQARVRTVTSVGQVVYRLASGRTPGLVEPPPPPPSVIFSRIHFAPAEDSAELVEITNRSASAQVLSENGNPLKIRGFDFTFPSGTTLAPGETVTVAAMPEAALRARVSLPAGRRVFTGSGKLSNSGEFLGLEAGGTTASWGESLTYAASSPWPTQAASLGWSLVRLNPEASADDPANWTASPVR